MSLVLTIALATTPLTFDSCRIGADDGVTMAAECARLVVPENHADADGRRISLAIAKVAAFRSSSLPPLVFIAGGPGQSALESFPQVAAAFGEVRKNRDILLVDQRGTGGSNPLQCEPLQDSEEMALEFDVARARAEAARCVKALDADLRFYTTLDAVEDLERLRLALGVEQFALYGISYGTRVAQEYLRRYPDRVEKLVLDGVVTAGEALGPQIAADAQAALELMFDRCAADEACASRFPDLRGRFDSLRARLEREPLTVEIRDPFTFKLREVMLNWQRVASLFRMYSYLPESTALLPLLLHQAETNDWQSLAGSVLALERENESLLYVGMHHSVVCSEDAPFFPAGVIEEPAYLGTTMTDFIGAVCEVWPQRELPEEMRTPVVSDVPALLLSGEADPVTPPRNAEAVARHLQDSIHLVAPGQGHGVAWRGCTPRLIAEFLAGAEEFDADCLSELRPYPFFIDANGPTP